MRMRGPFSARMIPDNTAGWSVTVWQRATRWVKFPETPDLLEKQARQNRLHRPASSFVIPTPTCYIDTIVHVQTESLPGDHGPNALSKNSTGDWEKDHAA